jgi:hypothetical protein
MKLVVIILLACVWIGLAFNAHSRGDNTMAGVFILIGTALTIVRLSR